MPTASENRTGDLPTRPLEPEFPGGRARVAKQPTQPTRRGAPAQATYRLVLEVTPGCSDDAHTLRRLLKYARRVCRLRCVWAEEIRGKVTR
jgi:hypothetical protein